MFVFGVIPRLFSACTWNSCVAGVLLCSFAICFAGVPVYQPPQKDRSQPFPCETCACGCYDAEACWRDCCCYTHAEKLAWAKKNGVTPPAFVIAAAKEELSAVKDCCRNRGRKAWCEKKAESCCDGGAQEENCCAAKKKSKDEAKGRWVTWIGRQKCQGAMWSWLLVGHAVAPTAEKIDLSPEGPGDDVVEMSATLESWSCAPEPPPPKWLSA